MLPNLSREQIEKEAREDLSKTDFQLLSDIHQEILRNDRSLKENAIHAMKRFSSLVTRSTIASNKSSEENIKLQDKVKFLTYIIIGLVVVQIIIGFFWP